jgi:PBP1b-binding outer membrane lipoprotein LpoB
MKKMFPLIPALLAVIILLVSCNSSTAPVQAVEDYLNALVAKDATGLALLSCADWAESAAMEMNSFQAVTTRLENLTCEEAGTDGIYTLVNCQGNIILSYDSEDQAIDLSLRTYQVVEQGGEYLICNYR